MDEKPNQPQQVQRVINVNIPVVYANSFQIGLSSSDIAITLMVNGQPFQILNVSYNTAKGLAATIDKAIKKYEAETNTQILTAKESSSLLTRTERK